MTDDTAVSRVLLRADVRLDDEQFVTHTLAITRETIVFVAPTRLEIGANVRAVLSFPRLVEEFEVRGRVVETAIGSGHGEPARATIEITGASTRARRVIDGLVALTSEARMRAARSTPGPYRCLLVEDNSFIRDLFAYGLDKYRRDRGADVVLAVANDADEAWEILKSGPFDLAIVDHFLPTRTGAELISQMRAEPRLAGLAVVAISVGGDEARTESIAAGADLFLDKPIVLRDLFSTLDKLTHQAQATS